MPDTRSGAIEDSQIEVPEHWAHDESNRQELGKVARQLGISLQDLDTFQDVFSVDRLHHFQGSLEDAKRRLSDWAIKRERDLLDRLSYPNPSHSEAKTIAWTYVVAPDGTRINVTAREGSTSESVAATVLALTGAVRLLGGLGFTSEKQVRR